jgi:hypothetical protein
VTSDAVVTGAWLADTPKSCGAQGNGRPVTNPRTLRTHRNVHPPGELAHPLAQNGPPA